jgi:hypothetical protein
MVTTALLLVGGLTPLAAMLVALFRGDVDPRGDERCLTPPRGAKHRFLF